MKIGNNYIIHVKNVSRNIDLCVLSLETSLPTCAKIISLEVAEIGLESSDYIINIL